VVGHSQLKITHSRENNVTVLRPLTSIIRLRLRHGRITSRIQQHLFIAGERGISADIPQHASYIADAQKIIDIVLGFHPGICRQV